MGIGVFLKSVRVLRPGTCVLDVARACAAVRELGFRTVRLGKLPDECYSPDGVGRLADMLRARGLTAHAVTMVYDGESYADLESVRHTLASCPPGAWPTESSTACAASPPPPTRSAPSRPPATTCPNTSAAAARTAPGST